MNGDGMFPRLFYVFSWVRRAHRASRLVIMAVCTFLAPSLLSAQQVIYVNASATGTNGSLLGASWAAAYTDLQDALDEAALPGRCTTEGPCEIWVAAGTYFPSRPTDLGDPGTLTFELRNNVAIYGGFAGWETERAQRDPVHNATIFNGDVLENDDPDFVPTSNCCIATNEPGCDAPACVDAVLNYPPHLPGFLRHCEDTWDESCVKAAEGLCCEQCTPLYCDNSYHVFTTEGTDDTAVLDGVVVTRGVANSFLTTGSGAGILIVNASPVIRNCTFVENVAFGAAGIAHHQFGEPTITGCTFLRNDGWGMIANGITDPIISDCDFIENELGGLSYSGSRAIRRCRFIRNSGSGLSLKFKAPNIVDCVFVANTASSGAGVFASGFPQLINCKFYANVASSGGGGIDAGGNGIILLNCIFTGNHAGGGGAARLSVRGPALVLNNTFAGNSAESIGGVVVGLNASATISNSIFWNNTDLSSEGEAAQLQVFRILPGPPPATVTYNSIEGWTGTMPNVWPEGNVDLDPLFVDAAGPDAIPGTEDDNLRLSPDSPLIDLGDPDPPLFPRFDADGHKRILCGRIDMGAYEFGLGDYDCNRLVNLTDFAAWPFCLTGPTGEETPPVPPLYPAGCEAFDFNADHAIDLSDFTGAQLHGFPDAN